MGQPQRDHIEIEDYIAVEVEDDMRYEYHDGQLFAMAGGTIPHSLLCNNIASELRRVARAAGTCVPFNSEMKVEVRPNRKYVYPDAGLACPKLIESKHITGAITNPTVIVEVISDGSAQYDYEDKRRLYFSLPSVMEYVLISQDRVSVTVMRRRGDLMKIDSYTNMSDLVFLESLAGDIGVADIYAFVEFE